MALCRKCGSEKEVSEFPKDKAISRGHKLTCKECYSKWGKSYYNVNHKNIKQKRAKRYCSNPNRQIKMSEEWRLFNLKRDSNNKKTYHRKKMVSDPQYKLAHGLRIRLRKAFKNNQKTGSAIRDLGCSIKELKIHLESKFQLGMTWDNWGQGKNKWNLDHIEPLCKFNLLNKEEQLKACHYANLQPLWQEEHKIKTKGDLSGT